MKKEDPTKTENVELDEETIEELNKFLNSPPKKINHKITLIIQELLKERKELIQKNKKPNRPIKLMDWLIALSQNGNLKRFDYNPKALLHEIDKLL